LSPGAIGVWGGRRLLRQITIASLLVAGSLLAVGAGVVGLGLRYRWPLVLDGLRRLSHSAFNPGQMETAGQPGAYASIIEHTGRVSGHRYRTPIVARPLDGAWIISLTYGTRADWVRNVQATGTATLITEGATHEHLRATIIPLHEAGEWTSTTERRLLGWFGITTCLRLSPETVGDRPGSRSDDLDAGR